MDGLMGELCARFDLSRKVKSRSSDTALVASGSRRGKSERFGTKRKIMGKKQSSSSGDNSTGSAGSGKEDRKVPCSICKETGYKWFKCFQRVCSICRENGHDPHKCPKTRKEDANLAISDQAGLVADAFAFVSVSQGGHEELLLETAKQRGVTLTGELRCEGCSMAKGRRKPIAKTTKSRADKRGGRVFLDVCVPKCARLMWGKKYMLLDKDDFSRFSAVCFMRSKSEISK